MPCSARGGGFGLARRQPMAMRWGGGVVVRAGESLVHGEGSQRIDAVGTHRTEALMNIGETVMAEPCGTGPRCWNSVAWADGEALSISGKVSMPRGQRRGRDRGCGTGAGGAAG